MPPQPPHFAVPGTFVDGDELLDPVPMPAGPHVFGVFFLITNAADQRCIKHLDGLAEYYRCVVALCTALNNGAADRNIGIQNTYQMQDGDTEYQFTYTLANMNLGDGVGMRVLAKCWAIHKYRGKSLSTGGASRSLSAQKMQERYGGGLKLGGGGGTKV